MSAYPVMTGGKVTDVDFMNNYDGYLFLDLLPKDALVYLGVDSIEDLAMIFGPEDDEYWNFEEYDARVVNEIEGTRRVCHTCIGVFGQEGIKSVSYQDVSPMMLIVNAVDFDELQQTVTIEP